MAEPKDIVLAILGAAGALAGLLLVFSGFVLSQASAFPATTDDKVIERFERAGRFGVWPFLLAVLIAILAFAWLLWPCSVLYWITIVGFAVLLLATGLYGGILFWFYL